MSEISDIGLVFGGGGAKGAYQIGVWNTFKIYGLDKYVKAVSGTSVGALNAVLFALGDYDKARQIWETITLSDMLHLNTNYPDNIYDLFSFDGIKKFIDSLDLEKLPYSNIDVYVSYKNIGDKNAIDYILEQLSPSLKFTNDTIQQIKRFFTEEVEFCKINDAPIEFIKNILLASIAMPIIYKCIHTNKKMYSDAGTTKFGNVPIEPLYENGFKNICVVPLKYNFDIHKIKTNIHAYENYKDCNFAIIKPSKDLGSKFDFSQKSIAERLELGEVDSYRVLRNAWIDKYSF